MTETDPLAGLPTGACRALSARIFFAGTAGSIKYNNS
jgi:hypothetical protein